MPTAAKGSMMSQQDIESELSYAYLHAVASAAGVACQQMARAHDNLGVDAELTLRREFTDAPLTEISIQIQLKATILPPRFNKGQASYSLKKIRDYDQLRLHRGNMPRLLVVLFLPEDPEAWLTASPEQLLMKTAAYWVSLVGAPDSDNSTGQTIYLPESNLLSPPGLVALFMRVARREVLTYVA